MENVKRIPFEHLYNCRDMGGYICDGGMIGWHRLYRAEAPCHLTAEEWARMQKIGVRTMIDLRSPMEQRSEPYETPEGIAKISYPLQQYEVKADAAKKMSREELAELAKASFGESLTVGYARMVEDAPKRMAYLLKTIAERLEEGAVLYHCSAGKDRTGILSAMVYLLCGVDFMDIVADYQVSSSYQAVNFMYDVIPEDLRCYMASPPETMEGFLKRAVKADYVGLLLKHGLTAETVSRLRRNLIVPY